MNNRERLINCITFQQVDRPPFLMGFGPWPETAERWQQESGIKNLDLEEYFQIDKGFLLTGVKEGLYPGFKRKIIEETERYVVFQDERGIVKKDLKQSTSMSEFLDYPVKTEEDWEQIKNEHLDPHQEERFDVEWDELKDKRKKGYAIQVGTFPYGVFGTPRDLIGAEDFLCAFISKPELIHDMMDYLTEFWIKIWEEVSNHLQIDHIHIWEDMSGKQGSLISPDMVKKFMMPNYRKIKAFADNNNIPVISVDTDGKCDELLPIMKENGINLMFPFEVQAGNEIEKLREQYPDFAIMGGLDKRAMAQGKKEIDKELAKAERMFKNNGYIANPDHLIPPDVSWENYCYYMESLKEIIGK